MGFDAADVVEALDYDLSKAGGPKGTVPEPTDGAVRRWSKAMQRQAIEAQPDVDWDKATPAQIAQAVMSLDTDKLADEGLDAYAELCGATRPSRKRPARPAPLAEGADDAARADHEARMVEWEADLIAWHGEWSGGSPTREQMAALPYRIQRAFFGWLTGEISGPEGRPAATKPSLEVVRSA